MNKKLLIVIIVILAIVLVAGIASIFVLPGILDNDAQMDIQPSDSVAADDGPENTGSQSADVEESVAADEPEEVSVPEVTDPEEAPLRETQPVKPTQPDKDNSQSSKPTEGDREETDEETGPLIPTETPDVEVPESDQVTYQDYYNMTADEQAAFINTFESIEAFFQWHTAAKEEYENDRIEIKEDETIDLGKVNGGD